RLMDSRMGSGLSPMKLMLTSTTRMTGRWPWPPRLPKPDASNTLRSRSDRSASHFPISLSSSLTHNTIRHHLRQGGDDAGEDRHNDHPQQDEADKRPGRPEQILGRNVRHRTLEGIQGVAERRGDSADRSREQNQCPESDRIDVVDAQNRMIDGTQHHNHG